MAHNLVGHKGGALDIKVRKLNLYQQNLLLLGISLPLKMQGYIKSHGNSYLNTGSFHKNLIYMWGVLKKSIFAYLKFDICIPVNFQAYLDF